MIRLTINGTDLELRKQETILDAVRSAGFDVPTLCFDERLDPIGSCRLCSVEVEGESHPLIACRTPVSDGMKIKTDSPSIEAFRRTLLRWEAQKISISSYLGEPDKELHQLLRAHDLQPSGKRRRDKKLDISHPLIRVDMSQCIDCLRCVHICNEVQGQFVWHVLDRCTDMHIVPDSGTTLGTSSCVGCGACVDTCPTGALTDRSETNGSSISRWTRTTCAYCGVGCELEVGIAAGRVARARPVI